MFNRRRTTQLTLLLAVALLGGGAIPTTARAGDAPGKKKRPDIYDRKADGNKQIAEALVKAKRDNTRVLLQFGANWCVWCYRLHDLFEKDKTIARELLYEYELVLIDVDEVDGKPHNEAVSKRYGNAAKLGLPALVVLDADGKRLVTQETGSLEEGDHHKPEKVMAFLEKWRAKPVSADDVLAAALKRATAESKKIFLYFGAPWCPYCHKLDDYLARSEVAEVFDKFFVAVKIDVDRTTGGKKVDAKYRGDEQGGLPYFAVLDAKGKKLADAHDAKGENVGFPVAPHEIEHFMKVMGEQAPKMSKKQLKMLEKALKQK